MQNHEIPIAGLYKPDRVMGLYPAVPPINFEPRVLANKTWVRNRYFWRDVLVKQMNFPVAKVRMFPIQSKAPHLLPTCKQFLDWDFIEGVNFSLFDQFAE